MIASHYGKRFDAASLARRKLAFAFSKAGNVSLLLLLYSLNAASCGQILLHFVQF